MAIFNQIRSTPRRPEGDKIALTARFAHDPARPASDAPEGGIEDLFWSIAGPVVHKGHHYLAICRRYFERFANTSARVLEIGVSKGGSLQLWRRFFGIDIDPACARFDRQAGQARIGSQDDAGFLSRVVDEMGGQDIVLDDGGVYMIEDLHAAHWHSLGGGYGKRRSFMSDVKQMIGDMHHWHHLEGQKNRATAGHVYDCVMVLEKERIVPLRHSQNGGAADMAAKNQGGQG